MLLSYLSAQPSLMLNIVSTVFLIRCNKLLFNRFECSFVSLTALNGLATLLGMVIAHRFGLFKIKNTSLLKTLPVSVTFCLSGVMANYSLKLNTTGTYQALKSIASPVILAVTLLVCKQEYKLRIFYFMVSCMFKLAGHVSLNVIFL